MAKFNEILVGRYNRLAQKLFAMKGGAPAPQLTSEISLAINLFHGKEIFWHQGWQMFSNRQAPTGAAGNNCSWQIRNPVSQNSIMVIEKLLVGSATAQTIIWTAQAGGQAADLATVALLTRASIDLRHAAKPSAIISTTTTGSQLSDSMAAQMIPANDSRDLINNSINEWTLAPGDALRLIGTVNATQIEVTCMWRERFLEDSERT